MQDYHTPQQSLALAWLEGCLLRQGRLEVTYEKSCPSCACLVPRKPPLGSNKAPDTENDPDAPRPGLPGDAIWKDDALDRRIQRHTLFRKRNVLGQLLPA